MHFTAECHQQRLDVGKDDRGRGRLGEDGAERFSVSGVHRVMLAKSDCIHKSGVCRCAGCSDRVKHWISLMIGYFCQQIQEEIAVNLVASAAGSVVDPVPTRRVDAFVEVACPGAGAVFGGGGSCGGRAAGVEVHEDDFVVRAFDVDAAVGAEDGGADGGDISDVFAGFCGYLQLVRGVVAVFLFRNGDRCSLG